MTETLTRATLVDVAKLAGVSARTVSRVFSTPEVVSEATRAKVQAAAERLLFKPNTLARDLRLGGLTKTLAFITAELTNPFYIQVAAGIESECSKSGFTMVLATSDDAESEPDVVDTMLASRMRGLLIVPVGDDHSYLEGERRLGTAIVSIDRPARNLLTDTVLLANREGGYLAAKQLIKAGHRSIGYVCNPANVYTQSERIKGYRQALAEADLPADGRWESTSDDTEVSMESLAAALFDMKEPPTAVVSGNNLATGGVIKESRNRGIQPGIVGFDDSQLAEILGISVIAHDPFEMGRTAARLVLRRLNDPRGQVENVEIPVHYIARGSGERPPRP